MRRLRIAGGVTVTVAAMALAAAWQGWHSSPAADLASQAAATAAIGPTTTAASSSEAAAAKIRVFIQYTATDRDAAGATELGNFLERRGFAVAMVRPVRFQIHKPSVRFFFERDRPGSEQLAETIRAFFADDRAHAPDHAIDLTKSPQKAEPGEVEVWLATS